MLPVSRLIGHKEYGNRAPGGYAGRKTDPQYNMDWRRGRVANFTPRTTTSQEVVVEDMPVTPHEMEMIARQTVDRAIVTDRAGNAVPLWRALGETYKTVGVLQDEIVGLKQSLAEAVEAAANRVRDDIRADLAAGYGLKLEPKDGEAPGPQ